MNETPRCVNCGHPSELNICPHCQINLLETGVDESLLHKLPADECLTKYLPIAQQIAGVITIPIAKTESQDYSPTWPQFQADRLK